jgi:heme-degrading monooxygenase HmoA
MKILTVLISLLTICTASAQNSNMEKTRSIEIIRYAVPEDRRQNFETAYTQAGEFLNASPYCKGYEMIHGTDEPQHYIIRIHWTSVEDHMQKFRNSAEFKSFFVLVRPFYNLIQEMKHYEAVVSTF